MQAGSGLRARPCLNPIPLLIRTQCRRRRHQYLTPFRVGLIMSGSTLRPVPMVKGTMGRKMSATLASGWYTAVAAKSDSTAPLAPRLGLIARRGTARRASHCLQACRASHCLQACFTLLAKCNL